MQKLIEKSEGTVCESIRCFWELSLFCSSEWYLGFFGSTLEKSAGGETQESKIETRSSMRHIGWRRRCDGSMKCWEAAVDELSSSTGEKWAVLFSLDNTREGESKAKIHGSKKNRRRENGGDIRWLCFE
ncbi:hypothetical protein L2E82_12367 [Cichorium intybus]|uniref:Uncharacterized protein n=1 Tax=Cichorium intybus TaxID=13427 RepID=A0ACB9GFW1_CICIN|nr:hypothetical protein L2E82_12367 [Cichorium intybus]